MKNNMKLRLLGYYNYPNQDMYPEKDRIAEANELAPLLDASLQSIYQNPKTDALIKRMIDSATVFVFKDEENHLYGYFTKNKTVRLTDVKYNKYSIEQIPFKYKAWFYPGKQITIMQEKMLGKKKELFKEEITEDGKQEISSPDVNTDAMNEVFDNMYITNVEKRLRELNAPSDIDKKRWVWELIQNAKDTIALDPNRKEINVRIDIHGDIVKFRHDGAPFTAKARYGLLYKYSGGKENQESTGRFGTGFLTTHCLSKIVTIESNQYSNKDCTELCGFEVTMYRDGLISSELIDGLKKMRASEKFFKQTFDWTTFTYHINSDSGRTAVKMGIDNFHENIAQTMLFCKELNSIELNDNGNVTRIKKLPQSCVGNNIFLAEYEIESPLKSCKRRFLFSHYEGPSKELSERYRADRILRLDVAIEIDENNNIVNHIGKTSHYCVLPLVGIEDQLCEPVIINSPDFEPDSERQSLMLSGQIWNEEKNVITETGINRIIYAQVFPIYEKLVNYLSSNKFGCLYYLATGLDKVKSHKNLDKEWYVPNVIHKYREILLKYNVVKTYNDESYKKLTDCIVVKEDKLEDEIELYTLLESLYPNKIVAENHEWSLLLWKNGLNLWSTEDLCIDVESKENWLNINLINDTLINWYNKFLKFISTYDVRYLTEYALLPNMNGKLLKKDTDGFQQGQNISTFIINLLYKLGKDVKPTLLHSDISTISLDSKYNSQSYSADVNRLAKAIIDNNQSNKISLLLPLISINPDNKEKYSNEFINQRKRFFEICTSLYSLSGITTVVDNNLLEGAWKELDNWFVFSILNSLKVAGSLSNLPMGLDARWLNNALLALNIQTAKLNQFEVLPNQEGTFHALKDLYEDAGIPDELKHKIFESVDMNYKKILLHKDIDASAFSVNQKKTISSFAADLREKFAITSESSNGNYFRGAYHYKSQEVLDKIALYVISILPQNKESELYKYQKNIYSISKAILTSQIYNESMICFDASDLWQSANGYVCSQIHETISSLGSVDALNTSLGMIGEVKVWDFLNKFYNFLSHANITYSSLSIFPNQNGIFKPFNSLNKDEGNIGDLLKDVILKLVDSESEYRNILIDTHSCLQPQAVINANNAYKLIDDKVYEYYQIPAKWEDKNYIDAVHELIEVWKEQYGLFNENNFPKTKPIEDSIVLNVVWKKEKRELLMNVSSKLTDEQIQIIIENSDQIGELTDKVKKLESENEILKSQLAALGMISEPDPEIKNADDYNTDKLSDVIIPVQIDCIKESGEHCTITVAEPQYAGLSADEMRNFLIQAKTDVKLYLEEKGYKFTKGICEDSWCNIYGVKDPRGKEVPIVVHSYKSRRRAFSLNTSDWEQLSKDGSMLWVVTNDGPQCVPFYALPRDTNTIAITFSPDNMQYKSRCIALAETLKYFKGLHFNFGTSISNNKTPEPFNNPNEELKLAMRDIHDLPAQSTITPTIGGKEDTLL